MYIPDLKVVSNFRFRGYVMKSVGWLDISHAYSKDHVPNEFKDKLWLYCTNIALRAMGNHICNLGSHAGDGRIVIEYKGQTTRVGSGITFVFGKDAVFNIPDMIFHYVVEHNYCPPDEFVQAVLTSPLPSSWRYKLQRRRLLNKLHRTSSREDSEIDFI